MKIFNEVINSNCHSKNFIKFYNFRKETEEEKIKNQKKWFEHIKKKVCNNSKK